MSKKWICLHNDKYKQNDVVYLVLQMICAEEYPNIKII